MQTNELDGERTNVVSRFIEPVLDHSVSVFYETGTGNKSGRKPAL